MALKINYVPSTRGKGIAEINGDLYYYDYTSQISDTTYYKCINNKKGCKARAIKRVIAGKETVELKNVHRNHLSHRAKEARLKSLAKAKSIAVVILS
jgi:hypothetical protein